MSRVFHWVVLSLLLVDHVENGLVARKRQANTDEISVFEKYNVKLARCGQTYYNQTKNGGQIIFTGDTLDIYCILQIKAPIGWLVQISIPKICIHIDDQLVVHDSYGKQWLEFSGHSKKSPCLLNEISNRLSTGNLVTIEVLAAFQLPYFEIGYTFIPQNLYVKPGSIGTISSDYFPSTTPIDSFYRVIAPENATKIQIQFTHCENSFDTTKAQCVTTPFDFHMSTRICSFLVRDESLVEQQCICDCKKILELYNDLVYETNDLAFRIFIPNGKFSFTWKTL